MIDTVERLLGNVIQTVVFKTDKDLREAVKYLSSENVGIARMISLESLSSRPQVTKVDTSEPLRKHITAKDINTVIADYLFNRVLVCDTTKDALELQLKVEDNTVIVSRDGVVCYSEGTVVAGSKENEQCGIFKRKKEIEKLIADIEMYKNEYDTVIHDKEICIITRDEAKHALAEVDDKLNIGRQVQQEQETNIKHYETESININDRIKGLDSEIARNNLDIEKYRLSKEEYERLLKDIHNSKKELEGQIKSEKNCLADMDIERAKLYENLKDIELSRHGFANNIEQDKQSAERLKQDINNYNSNIQEKTRERESAQVEIKRIKEKIDILRENLKKETASREELQKTYTEIREDYNGLLDTIEEERREIKVYQNDLEDISDQKHDLDVVCTRDDEQLRAIREKIYNAYEIDLQSPPDDISVVEKEDSEIIESIHIFKERLRHVSDVNMGAIHEYEKESKDLKEILLQRDDLRTAVDDLAQAIKKLNREARVQFKETFDSVKKRFMEMFTTLFEGGEVSLTLEENVDPLYADIKIDARPAGKKMRGISLLSGGEKALTAISLLFAMYMVKPSAYCILDELDAPLDDANIERFIRILRKFSDKTQFIIVTHNKHTMEAADLLYGVTQEESGVSTVASVLPSDSEQLRAA